MGRKDPAADAAYRRERRARLKLDPEWVAKKNAEERARYARKVADPNYRGGMNARAAAWRAANPERVAEVMKRHNLKRWYGLTLEDYRAMLAAQGGGCAICGELETAKHAKMLAVDHDHATGKVRGLLCNNCNHLLGKAKDNVGILRAAIAYLAAPR